MLITSTDGETAIKRCMLTELYKRLLAAFYVYISIMRFRNHKGVAQTIMEKDINVQSQI